MKANRSSRYIEKAAKGSLIKKEGAQNINERFFKRYKINGNPDGNGWDKVLQRSGIQDTPPDGKGDV
jgi:hypothetical protein